ncbi:MAG TPA: hypothetical protein VNO30_19360 [Kofleriaceae bacterium]|nr:hypothetical protein [Kofleriaceae bacterium]
MRKWQWIAFVVLTIGACDPRDEESSTTYALSAVGCADGQREGFTDVSAHPNIAGCSGAWTIPSIHNEAPGAAPACPGLSVAGTSTPACDRNAGDDGANALGTGCNVADLCAVGWHVCSSVDDVAEASATGCAGATRDGDPPLFFASRQTSTGCGQCATGTSTAPSCNSSSCAAGCLQTAETSNDVFGCGNYGSSTPNASCSPLDRFSQNLCSGLSGSPWSCNLPTSADNNGLCEAYTVTKSGTSHGGVLCCRDPNQSPDCTGATADPAALWPPNHKLVSVQVAGVVDPDPNDEVTIAITSIFQDEPVNIIGDGDTEVDADGLGSGTARVRAERTGSKRVPGDGRVYHIGFVATDTAGATCSGTVTVCVPHDQGQGSACVDGGPLYDSTAP